MTKDQIAAARAHCAKAREYIGALCEGKRKWTMRIPYTDEDDDTVLMAAVESGEAALSEIERLQAQVDALLKAGDVLAANLRYVEEQPGKGPTGTQRALDDWQSARGMTP